MAEQKKEKSALEKVQQFFGGAAGNAERELRDRKSRLERAEMEATGDTKAANGEERPGYSKKWVE